MRSSTNATLHLLHGKKPESGIHAVTNKVSTFDSWRGVWTNFAFLNLAAYTSDRWHHPLQFIILTRFLTAFLFTELCAPFHCLRM